MNEKYVLPERKNKDNLSPSMWNLPENVEPLAIQKSQTSTH